MPRLRNTIPLLATAAALTLALGGCGSSVTPPTATQAAEIKQVPIALASPVVKNSQLPSEFTCDGRNVSPPLAWGTVPASVQELVVFAVGLRGRAIDWAMAGVKPALHRLAAGEIPHGAFLLETSAHAKSYSICPTKAESYAFVIFAVRRGLRVDPRVSGPSLLTQLVEGAPQYRTPAVGRVDANYKRK